MDIYHSLEDIGIRRPSAVALGFFDGLHIGHSALVAKCAAFAKARGLSAGVFTFSDHPSNVLAGKMVVPRLLSHEEKLKLLGALGVDRVYEFDFADGFHTMAPEAFARTMLKDAFSAEAVFCGFNFRFGADAAGDTDALAAYGKELGFEAHVIDPVYAAGLLVSSSLIRHSVSVGEVPTAALLLGRDYSLSGIVEEGRRLGRELGFPTANIFPDTHMALPAYGVYITETLAGGVRYPSISNIGVNPTIAAGSAARVETHLLDADIELYGHNISVFFKKMLREERRYESKEALMHQIAADTETARAFFKNQ